MNGGKLYHVKFNRTGGAEDYHTALGRIFGDGYQVFDKVRDWPPHPVDSIIWSKNAPEKYKTATVVELPDVKAAGELGKKLRKDHTESRTSRLRGLIEDLKSMVEDVQSSPSSKATFKSLGIDADEYHDKINDDTGEWAVLARKGDTWSLWRIDDESKKAEKVMDGPYDKLQRKMLRGALTEAVELTEVVRKIGSKYCVVSHKTGKKMGCYDTKTDANKRLGQIQYFKAHGHD